jgi:tight adherence protein C
MILLVLSLATAGGSLLFFTAQALRPRRELRVSLARASGRQLATPSSETAKLAWRRLTQRVAAAALSLARPFDLDAVAARLLRAGVSSRFGPDEFVALKLLCAAVAAALGILLSVLSAKPATGLLIVVVFAALGFIAPEWVLHARARSRREEIATALPDKLDLMAVTVEAGLGLDAALARIAAGADGAFAEELGLAVAQMRMGESRAAALKGLAERVDVPELTSFVRAVVHADRLGTSITRTLRIQASEARSRRQSAVEELVGRTPVKMLLPTVLFIFPALFVVVLGPALLQLVWNLG